MERSSFWAVFDQCVLPRFSTEAVCTELNSKIYTDREELGSCSVIIKVYNKDSLWAGDEETCREEDTENSSVCRLVTEQVNQAAWQTEEGRGLWWEKTKVSGGNKMREASFVRPALWVTNTSEKQSLTCRQTKGLGVQYCLISECY